jgi:hypothetical protein
MSDTNSTPTPKAADTEKPVAEAAPAKAAEKPAAAATAEKPAAPAAAAKPAAPAEPAFTTDVLQNCTSRFSYRGWHLYLSYRSDLEKIKTVPVRSVLTARTPEGAQEIERILREDGAVKELTRRNKEVHFTAPFATVQLVIKHPQTHTYDAVAV